MKWLEERRRKKDVDVNAEATSFRNRLWLEKERRGKRGKKKLARRRCVQVTTPLSTKLLVAEPSR